MRPMPYKAMTSACGFLFLILAQLDAQELTETKIVEMLGAAIDSIRSFDVYVEVTERVFLEPEFSGKGKEAAHVRNVKLEPPRVEQSFFRQVFQKGKGRIEFLDGRNGNLVRCCVYDAETEKTWNPKQATSLVREPTLGHLLAGQDYVGSFRNIHGRLELMKCLRERSKVRLATADGNLFVIEIDRELSPEIDYPNYSFRLALEPRRGFLPQSIETLRPISNDKSSLFVRKIIDEWKDVGGGLFVPIRGTTRVFDTDPKMGTLDEPLVERVFSVDLARSTWNKELPEHTFHLPVPPGTRVTDEFRKVQYVTGRDDTGQNLKDLATHARQLVPVRIGSGEPSRSYRTIWIALGLGVVIIGCGVVYCFRKRIFGPSL